jgi:hypothetical protein
MQFVRVAAAVLGALILLTTAESVLKALVLPGARTGFLIRTTDRAIDWAFRAASKRLHRYETRHRVLALEGPVFLAGMLGVWLVLFVIGYTLLLWPWNHSMGAAWREAGSSLFTLGFASTHDDGPTFVDFIAAATGLIVVALQIAYLPTLYGAFNRRETEVALVGVRAGRPAWGPELLARTRLFSSEAELADFYSQWERWAADVGESHASYPILLRFRSPDPYSSWLIALMAVMDSAALFSAVSPDAVPMRARLALQMGFRSLRQLADTLRMTYDEDPRPDADIQLTREQFDAGISRLSAAGFPMERTPDEAWPHFRGWRVNYESIAYRLAYQIDAVPAPWSGPRRFPSEPLAPRRTINRTPEDPDGKIVSPSWRWERPAT